MTKPWANEEPNYCRASEEEALNSTRGCKTGVYIWMSLHSMKSTCLRIKPIERETTGGRKRPIFFEGLNPSMLEVQLLELPNPTSQWMFFFYLSHLNVSGVSVTCNQKSPS